MARLTLTTESGTTHSVELDETRYTVGRAGDCGIQIEDLSLSSHHARVERRDDGWHLIDLESTNGSKVNGTEVEGEQILRHDDAVALGDVTGFFTDLSDVSRTREMPGQRRLEETRPVTSRDSEGPDLAMAWRLVAVLTVVVLALSIALAVALTLLWQGGQ